MESKVKGAASRLKDEDAATLKYEAYIARSYIKASIVYIVMRLDSWPLITYYIHNYFSNLKVKGAPRPTTKYKCEVGAMPATKKSQL